MRRRLVAESTCGFPQRLPEARPLDGWEQLREPRLVVATFPSRGVTSALTVVGGVAAVATGVLFAHAFSTDLSGLAWSTPFLGAYAAGVIAFRARPDHVAARRLLVFGAVATMWIGATVALVTAFDDLGRPRWLGPANVAVQFLGLGMGAAMIALLAVYPDGAYGRDYERRLVRGVAGLAVAVPLALLLTRPTVQPSWGFAWEAESPDSSADSFPAIASPLH